MRRSGRKSWAAGLFALGLAAFGAPLEASALGITLPIEVELGPQRTGRFGTVRIDEIAGGDLEFTLTLGPVLGSQADLHEFYFNLPARFDPDGLAITGFRCDGGSCDAPFDLGAGRAVRGGAGARFDFSVNFGQGAGRNGNGTLQVARFVLGADEALSLADVLAEASSTGRGLETLFAAHVTGSGAGHGSASATIGVAPSAVPEPATAALFAVGLAGLAFGGRKPGS